MDATEPHALLDPPLPRRLDVAIVFEATTAVDLPGWLGSTLHGALGHALAATACSPACRRRHPRRPCAYATLFEQPTADGAPEARFAAAAPQTLILRPPPPGAARRLLPGDRLPWAARLVGPGCDQLGPLLAALELAARTGLGPRRGQLALRAIEVGAPATVAPSATWETLALRTITPLRLLHDRVLVQRPTPTDLALGAARRLAALDAHLGPGTFQPTPDAVRHAVAEVTEVAADWSRFRVDRYSSRQDQRHAMEGLSGHATYRGRLGAFAALLAAASQVGLGKSTSFGFGHFEVAQVGYS